MLLRLKKVNNEDIKEFSIQINNVPMVVVAPTQPKVIKQGAVDIKIPDWENAKLYYDWIGNRVEIGTTLMYEGRQQDFAWVAGFSREDFDSFLRTVTRNSKSEGIVFKMDVNTPKPLADVIVNAYVKVGKRGERVFEVVEEKAPKEE